MTIQGVQSDRPLTAFVRPPAQPRVDSVDVSLGMAFVDRLRLGRPRQGAIPATAPGPVQAEFPGVFRPAWRLAGVTPGLVVAEKRHVVAAGASAAAAAAVATFDGLAWAGALSSNGKRDATVLIPKGLDLSRPVEVITYFHGNGGTAAASTREFAHLVRKLPAKGRNAIVIIPTGGVKEKWMSPAHGESLRKLQDQGVAIAEQLTGRKIGIGSYTVEGFSGGGLPIATAAKAGELRASKINLFDSTYGYWGEAAVKHRQPGATVNVFYTEHNRERALRLEGLKGVTVEASSTNHGGTPGTYFFR